MEKRDKRVIIHFLWKQGMENKAIWVKINEVYGEKTVSLRSIQKWTN